MVQDTAILTMVYYTDRMLCYDLYRIMSISITSNKDFKAHH